MTIIVKADGRFGPDDWSKDYAAPEAAYAKAYDLPASADPQTVPLHAGLAMIRVDFPTFADGRGFTIARQLRLRGYTGRLRARGHVLADQFAMARRAGFDEVEISDALAARQPQEAWQARADWRSNDYQARLRG